MISYPIYDKVHDNCDFTGIKFVRNAGPNFVDDGLIGWIEFDENDSDTLKYVVHELTLNTCKWEYGNVKAYEAKYYDMMAHIMLFLI